MNISDLLGAVLQSGMAPSSNERMRNALGGSSGNQLESLGGMLGGSREASRAEGWATFSPACWAVAAKVGLAASLAMS